MKKGTKEEQGKNMLVIRATSEAGFLESVGIRDAFSVTHHVPLTLKTEDAKKVLERLNVFTEEDIDAVAEALNDVDKVEQPGKEQTSAYHIFYACRQDIAREY